MAGVQRTLLLKIDKLLGNIANCRPKQPNISYQRAPVTCCAVAFSFLTFRSVKLISEKVNENIIKITCNVNTFLNAVHCSLPSALIEELSGTHNGHHRKPCWRKLLIYQRETVTQLTVIKLLYLRRGARWAHVCGLPPAAAVLRCSGFRLPTAAIIKINNNHFLRY